MLVISVRQFTQNPNKYLNGLPVMLTRYGLPIAKVTGVTMEFKDEKGVQTDKPNQVPVPEPVKVKNLVTGKEPVLGSPKEKINILNEPVFNPRCPHGAYPGFCPECDALVERLKVLKK